MSPHHDEHLDKLLTRSDLDRLEITAGQISAWIAESWLEQIGVMPAVGGAEEPVFAIGSRDIRSYLDGMLAKIGKPAVEMSPLRARSELLRALSLRRGIALPVDALRLAARQEAGLETQELPASAEAADALRCVRDALDAEIRRALAADAPVPRPAAADRAAFAPSTAVPLAEAGLLAVAAAALIDELEATTGTAGSRTPPMDSISNRDAATAATLPRAIADTTVATPAPATGPARPDAPTALPADLALTPAAPTSADDATAVAAADTMAQALEDPETTSADGSPTDAVAPVLTTTGPTTTSLRLADLFCVTAQGATVSYSNPPSEVNPDHLTEAEIAELIIDSSVRTPEVPAAVFRGEHAAEGAGAAAGAALASATRVPGSSSPHAGTPTIVVQPSTVRLDLAPMTEELVKLRTVLTDAIGRESRLDLQPLVAALQADQATDSAHAQGLLAAVQALGGDLRGVTAQMQATNKTALAALATTAFALDREPGDHAPVVLERAPRRAGLVLLTVAFMLAGWAAVVYFKTHDLRTTMGGVVAANVVASVLLAFRRNA